MILSQRARAFSPSATLAIAAKAARLRAEGLDIISFSTGEPDFDTPEHIKAAATRALREGFTKYTATGGTEELKEAIRTKLKRDNGLTYGQPEVMASVGAKHVLYNVAAVLLDEGDEVVIPSPYWLSYPEQVKLVQGRPVFVPTREADGFRLRVEAVARALTPRTKLLILNTPANPTGAILERGDLEALADLVVSRNLLVISDECYEPFTYEGSRHLSLASLGEAIKARTILVHTVSKAYAMTGWRIGYAAGPAEIIQAMIAFQSQVTSNPTSVAQRAAQEALTGPQDPVSRMVAEFDRRRRRIVDRLNAMPGVRCVLPPGAFYAFPNVSGLFGRWAGARVIQNSSDLAAYLLEEARIAVVPGLEFGDDRYLRLSYATSLENIQRGMDRMARAATQLT